MLVPPRSPALAFSGIPISTQFKRASAGMLPDNESAPAAFSRLTKHPRLPWGPSPRHRGSLGRHPRTVEDSFIVIGAPRSGLRAPRASVRSISLASIRVRPKLRAGTALILPSCSAVRAIVSASNSAAEIPFGCSAAIWSRNVAQVSVRVPSVMRAWVYSMFGMGGTNAVHYELFAPRLRADVSACRKLRR